MNAYAYFYHQQEEDYFNDNYTDDVVGFYYSSSSYVNLIKNGKIISTSKAYTPKYYRQNYDLSLDISEKTSTSNYMSCVSVEDEINKGIYVYIPQYNEETGKEIKADTYADYYGSFLIEGQLFNQKIKQFLNPDGDYSVDNQIKKITFDEYDDKKYDLSLYTKQESLVLYYHNSVPLDVYLNNNKTELLFLSSERIWLSFYSNEMFSSFRKLEEITFNNVYGEDIMNMDSMFKDCVSLKSVNMGNLNLINLQSALCAFMNCTSLKEVYINSKVCADHLISIISMFRDCTELEYIDISTFDFTNLLSSSCAFADCQSLKTIYVRKNISFPNISLCDDMFYNCTSLPNFDENIIDITNANTSETGYFLVKSE